MNKEKIKEIIKSKEGITLLGVITLLLVITIINVAVKDTHAYYNSVTDPVQIFNSRVGNFKPRIDSFYIKENNGQLKYTNSNINIVYLTPGNNNRNLDQVCITETDDISTCNNKWQPIQSNNQYSYTFTNEGTKVIFGFIKDKYGNKSAVSVDTITYDITPPTVWYSLTEGEYTGAQTITIVPSDNLSGVGFWAVHVYKDGIKIEEQSGNNLTGQPNFTVNLTEGSSWTVYTQVYDNAGNIITQQPNTGDGWVYQTYTIKSKSVKNYLDKYATGANGVQTLQDTPVDGLYRYCGKYQQVTNNYICFGTNNKTECLNSPDKYMYRIIGITDGSQINTDLGLVEGQLKLIKATPYGTSKWFSSNDQDGNWNNSILKGYLNNDFLTDAKTNQWQNGTYWDGLITNQYWYMEYQSGVGTYYQDWPVDTHLKPNEISEGLTDGKIGLMYATDYVNSYGSSGVNWLEIREGWSTSSTLYDGKIHGEWTMGRSDINGWSLRRAWHVDNYRDVVASAVAATLFTRPVFYLIPDITLTGEGTESNPFIISV